MVKHILMYDFSVLGDVELYFDQNYCVILSV